MSRAEPTVLKGVFSMKKGWLCGLLCALALSAQAAEPHKTLRLSLGEQQSLQTKYSVKRSAIGNPGVASLRVLDSRNFLITAKGLGSTNLLLWQGQNEPTTIQIDVVPDVSANASFGVAIDASGDKTVLSGKTSSLSQHDQLLSMAGANVIDDTVEQGAIQVQTDIRIIEYSRSQLKQIGTAMSYIDGNASIATGSTSLLPILSGNGPVGALLGGAVTGSSASSILFGYATNSFKGAINALQRNGYAYTLAEPSLVSLSGQTASFLAGGEFPYPVSNRDGQVQIEYKEFGVRLRLTPTILNENSIMLKVAPEVSDLDFSSGVQAAGVAVPSLRVRRTDTTVQLAPGESFIISGLVSRSTFNNANRVPGLGDIPILGALFRSSNFEQEDKELLMIVTPHLVKPIAKNIKLNELPGETYRSYVPSFTGMMFGNSTEKESVKHRSQEQPSANVGFAN
jgi:pilus assembly protein CpaC